MALTTIARDPLLDLDPWVGQRSCTFKFYVTDGATKRRLGELHPIRPTATLTHDTSSTTKRQLRLDLGTSDSASINPLADRVSPYMVFTNAGVEYPLGTYVYNTPSERIETSGKLTTAMFSDEMLIVDQPILNGIDGTGANIGALAQTIVSPFGFETSIEASDYPSSESWVIGTTRGQILESLATNGGYFSPWFDNTGAFSMIRTFDPATKIPSIDLDQGNRVLRSSIVKDSDLLTAPNTILVISNGSTSTDPVSAIARVSPTAPNSRENRGFELVQVQNLQVGSSEQAAVVAKSLIERQIIYERINLTTPPDPRHDGYNVIRFLGVNWLELSWSMSLIEGGQMTHQMRRAYK